MAARASLDDLIKKIRRLISDKSSAAPHFTDDDIQDTMDRHRDDVKFLRLDMVPTFQPSQIVQYLEFYSEQLGGYWEKDVLLQDANWQTVTPSASDYTVGKWTFAATPVYPIYLSGKQFDLYAAAVELLEEWAGDLADKFDYSSDQQKLMLSQKMDNKLKLAAQYRGKVKPKTAKIERDDIANDCTTESALDYWMTRGY